MKERILKLLILLVAAYAMSRAFDWPESLTYFTYLSNIFAAAVCAFQLFRPGEKAVLWKYAATVSVIITFLVFLLVLAPMNRRGLMAAYASSHWSSLCLHLIVPLLSVIDFILIDAPHMHWQKKHIPLAMLPPAVYYLYVLILALRGYRWGRDAGPYFFLNYKGPAGWFGFVPEKNSIGVVYALLALMCAFFLVGWGLWGLARRREKNRPC